MHMANKTLAHQKANGKMSKCTQPCQGIEFSNSTIEITSIAFTQHSQYNAPSIYSLVKE